MDVTKHNFHAVAAELEALLDKCEFVAFDEEMTGINLMDRKLSPANTPAENYALQREVSQRYSIIQIGICPFLRDPDAPDRWIAYPFNFFVFPDSAGSDVTLSASAIAFNRQHGMDFQKWIYQGVPYVSAATEQALREKTWPKPKSPDGKEEQPAKRQKLQKEGDNLWFQEEWARFEAWVQLPFEEDREFRIAENGAVQRKFFEAQVQATYPNLQLESHLKNPGSGSWARNYFVVQRSEKSRKECEEREMAHREMEYHRKVGFYRIYKALAEKRKPLVGHNLLFDLLFMMAAFEGNLPETWDEWKALTHERFPTIYDTKYLAQSNHIPNGGFETTALEPLYKALSARQDAPSVHLPLGFEAYSPMVLASVKKDTSSGSRAHEAAYDALMTGTVFLALRTMLEDHDAELVNRANLMSSLHELHFTEPDPLARGIGPVLHLTFDSTLITADLLNCFGELPGTITWINDSSAFACMGPDVLLEAALAQLRAQPILKTVQTLDEFRSAKPP